MGRKTAASPVLTWSGFSMGWFEDNKASASISSSRMSSSSRLRYSSFLSYCCATSALHMPSQGNQMTSKWCRLIKVLGRLQRPHAASSEPGGVAINGQTQCCIVTCECRAQMVIKRMLIWESACFLGIILFTIHSSDMAQGFVAQRRLIKPA